MCPRIKKDRIQIDPDSLIPQLPSPKDLKPFPYALAITYAGHTGKIRSISIDPTGQWLASGMEMKTIEKIIMIMMFTLIYFIICFKSLVLIFSL